MSACAHHLELRTDDVLRKAGVETTRLDLTILGFTFSQLVYPYSYPQAGRQGPHMELLDHNAEGVIIQLDERELNMLLALEQEGRLSHNRKEPTGQALDELLRTAAVLVQQARQGLQVRDRGH